MFFFVPDIHFSSRISRDSRAEWHTRNAGNSWRLRAQGQQGKDGSEGEPGVKGSW